MSTSTIPPVLPADEPFVADAVAVRPGPRAPRGVRLVWLFGSAWRFAVGTLLCLNYFSSVLVVGWLNRRVQGAVLRGWWKGSPLSREGTFEDFCASLGHDAPTARPRWLCQERLAQTLRRPTPRGQQPGRFRAIGRVLLVPWHSLWLNFRVGFLAMFCTYLVTGFGCLLMTFSWEFGWLNSFHKGYELAFFGPGLGLTGILLFMAAMFYVPMAQVHQAVTGDPRAFFDFRFVWRLIQARPLAYVGLAALIGLLSLPLEICRIMPRLFEQINPQLEDASDAELLRVYHNFRLGSAAGLFAALLIVRLVAARIYRFAVLKVLAFGWATDRDLHPVLHDWLTRLDCLPPRLATPEPFKGGMGSLLWWCVGGLHLLALVAAVVLTFAAGPQAGMTLLGIWIGGWGVLGLLALFAPRGLRQYVRFNVWQLALGALFWIWFAFVAKVYVSEFVNYHPIMGFMNHALVQLPCLDAVQGELGSDGSR